MYDFFNPKNVTIGSGVDQNKKLLSFWPIGQKLPHFNVKFFLAIKNSKFTCKMSTVKISNYCQTST